MTREIQRRDVLKGVGAAGIATLAGCSGGGGGDGGGGDGGGGDGGGGTTTTKTTTEGPRSAKLGVLMPLTGDLASVGKPIRDGCLLPVEQLKDADLPFTIDAQVEDTQTDPQAGINAAKSLANAGYPSVNGPASSGVNMKVAQQVLIPNQMVGCSPSSTSSAVTQLEDNDFIFRTAPSDALQGKVLAQVAVEKLDVLSASTLYVNNAYGQLLSQEFAKAMKNQGAAIEQQVSFEKEQSSYTSRISQALQNDPETLLIIGYPASGVQLLRDFYSETDLEIPLLATDGLQDPTLPSKVGNDLTNVTGTAPMAAGPAREFFNQTWKEIYGGSPGVFTSQAYDSTAVQLLANAAAGSNDGTAVRDNMRKVANPGGTEVTPENLAEGIKMAANGEDVQYAGASSSVDFDDNGDMKAVTYAYWGFTKADGEYKVETKDTIAFKAD